MISIGWIPVDRDGAVHQATVSNAYSNMFDRQKRKPTRKAVRKVYVTRGKASQYSPVGKAKEVFTSE